MNHQDELIEQARKGFESLDVADQYKESALRWLLVWLTDPMFQDYVPQVEYLIDSGN